jgi:hypothetical protein
MRYTLHSQRNTGKGEKIGDKIDHIDHAWSDMNEAIAGMIDFVEAAHPGTKIHHNRDIGLSTVMLDNGDYINYWVRADDE